jgi:eukaryotic-like serine/threonine-protein kinase
VVDIEHTARSPGAGSDPNDPRIGSVVGKYVIVRLLGRGGMGAVYEARHAQLSRRFAVKFLLPEFATHAEVLARFESEAKAAGGLEHPNLVAVTDAGRSADGAPYLVMEFLQGEDCSQLLQRLGPLPATRAADLVLQACRGLAVAHKAGIVHRDLKPENLFVTDAGDGTDRVKVLDFGIAQIRSPDRSRVTRTGATLGTAHYMSPEQARAAADLDSRTDVWSLGVVLYELLSGHKPFEGERFLHVIHQILSAEAPPLGTLRAGLPPALVALVERAMTKEVGARLPTVTALADGLLPFAGRTSVPPDQAALGHAATVATEKTGMTAARSKPSAPGVSPRSTWRWVVAGVGAIAAAAILLALRLTSRPHEGPSVAAGPAVASEVSMAPQPRVPGSDMPGPSGWYEPADGGAWATSERSEHSSNKSRGPAAGAKPPISTSGPVAFPAPKSATTAPALFPQPAPSGDAPPPAPIRRTKIDHANPY